MNRSYWDTSAVLKLFVKEAGSEYLEKKLLDVSNRVVVCHLTIVEVHSVLYRQVRKSLLKLKNVLGAQGQLQHFIRHNQLSVFETRRKHFDSAIQLIQHYGEKRECQTLDAIQLAVAVDIQQRYGLSEFVCADHGLLSLAKTFGLPTIDPETV